MLTGFVWDKKELKIIESKDLMGYINKKNVNIWVNITDFATDDTLILKEVFDIHPTTIEDIFSQQTRVKYEESEDYTTTIFKGIEEVRENSVEIYNISFVMGGNFMISFVKEDKSEVIRELSKNNRKIENLLKRGKGYLVHYILDKEVDKFLRIKSDLGEELKQIEREFRENPDKELMTKIFLMELNFIELRQLSESITDICLSLTKPAENYIKNDLIPYFKDVYDHALKTADGYKSMLSRVNGMKNMYATITSMKTNEVMRSLTIIMALMMPLTIITGFYGMNVKLPLQENLYAPLLIFLGMIFSAIVMIIISKKAGWISKED